MSTAFVWRRVDRDGSLEHARVRRTGGGVVLDGTIVAIEQGQPLRLRYVVRADAQWRSRSVVVRLAFGGRTRRLMLERTADGWQVDGVPAPALAGCEDIDLELSPVTNALPINRLGLAVSHAASIRAAWVRLPRLAVEPAEQRYERLATDRYRFTGLDSGFTAVLTVDALGLPVEYEGLWRRIAASG